MTEVYSIGPTKQKGTAANSKDMSAAIAAFKKSPEYKSLQSNPIAMKQFNLMLANRANKFLFLDNGASRELYREAGGLNLFG